MKLGINLPLRFSLYVHIYATWEFPLFTNIGINSELNKLINTIDPKSWLSDFHCL